MVITTTHTHTTHTHTTFLRQLLHSYCHPVNQHWDAWHHSGTWALWGKSFWGRASNPQESSPGPTDRNYGTQSSKWVRHLLPQFIPGTHWIYCCFPARPLFVSLSKKLYSHCSSESSLPSCWKGAHTPTHTLHTLHTHTHTHYTHTHTLHTHTLTHLTWMINKPGSISRHSSVDHLVLINTEHITTDVLHEIIKNSISTGWCTKNCPYMGCSVLLTSFKVC